MTPQHEKIYEELRDAFPDANHYSINLQHSVWQDGRVFTGKCVHLHAGDWYKAFDSLEEVYLWFERRGTKREILFRRFAA